jgi:hypothetical protein
MSKELHWHLKNPQVRELEGNVFILLPRRKNKLLLILMN